MAFVSPDLAEHVALVNPTDSDGTKTTDTVLNDGSTAADTGNEIRNGHGCYKITHDLGFAVADLDSLSVRIFDGLIMNLADILVYPYSSGDSAVVTGNEATITVVDDGTYDAVTVSAGFRGDLEDVGTNQISLRLVWAGTPMRYKGREIQIEFAEAAGGALSIPVAVAHYRRRRQGY